MTEEIQSIGLKGRIIIQMDIKAVTGLRIGGSPAALAIGEVDNPVIRDPITLRPYIPGSSLRGKLRSLWEKANNASQNQRIGKDVRIHGKIDAEQGSDELAVFESDSVLPIFGVTGDNNVPNPTRLIVHDAFLSEDSVNVLNRVNTDQPFTETKWEAAIDRITSAAVPRQMERVPAGTIFNEAKLVYSLYGTQRINDSREIDWFMDIFTMLMLIEDDYLGSSGSRGSGRVEFRNIKVSVKKLPEYVKTMDRQFNNLEDLYPQRESLYNELIMQFGLS